MNRTPALAGVYCAWWPRCHFFAAHGDVVQLAGASGEILWEYDYDAFGNEKDIDGQDKSLDNNPFRYCGEYFDEETGDIYLRARYYNPRLGRFGAEDPIRDGLNWYTYCGNRPIMFVDPMGLNDVMLDYIAAKNNWTYNESKGTYKGGEITFIRIDTKIKSQKSPSVGYFVGREINGHYVVDSEILAKTFGIKDNRLITHQEYDRFNTLDDAALAWGMTYNPKSISTNLELSSWIYADEDGYFFAGLEIGDDSSVGYGPLDTNLGRPAAHIHSHAAYDPDYKNDFFSNTDFQSDDEVYHIFSEYGFSYMSYLTTPSGYLLSYKPIGGIPDVITQSLQRDPNIGRYVG